MFFSFRSRGFILARCDWGAIRKIGKNGYSENNLLVLPKPLNISTRHQYAEKKIDPETKDSRAKDETHSENTNCNGFAPNSRVY